MTLQISHEISSFIMHYKILRFEMYALILEIGVSLGINIKATTVYYITVGDELN